MTDFSYAFSKHRVQAGGSYSTDGNAKAASFTGTADISKWTTSAAESLEGMFYASGSMNADLTNWKVQKVTTMANTFQSAAAFTGLGLNKWKTTALTSLLNTFSGAIKFDRDMQGWAVTKVTTFASTFLGASSFKGMARGRENKRKSDELFLE